MIAACVDGACAEQVAPAGTVPESQAAGDCKELYCDGRGQAITREDRNDTPADDGNDCTEERCAGDSPEHAPLAAGAACGQGGLCNGAGLCGVCLPGKRRCAGKVPEGCAPNGQWDRGAACAGDAPVCSRGACSAVVDLALGESDSCFLLSDGSARCSGSALGGTLGEGGPRIHIPISGATDLAVGAHHACAITGSDVACWGDVLRIEPGVRGAVQLAAGDDHTCARLTDGSVVCWGKNHKGQLGGGAAGAKDKGDAIAPAAAPAAPVDLAGPFALLAIGRDRACARANDGSVECWGAGARRVVMPQPVEAIPAHPAKPPPPPKPGPAPHAKPAPAPHPPPPPKLAPVRGIKGAAQIAAAGDHTCARLADGSIVCWGDAGKGQGTAPAAVPGIKGATRLAVGRAHACAATKEAEVVCWGDNDKGQLGDGSTTARRTPAKVAGLAGVTALAARGDHTCARLSDGSVRCWGGNASGELADGSTAQKTTPVEVRW
jgi:hypothetical protein